MTPPNFAIRSTYISPPLTLSFRLLSYDFPARKTADSDTALDAKDIVILPTITIHETCHATGSLKGVSIIIRVMGAPDEW